MVGYPDCLPATLGEVQNVRLRRAVFNIQGLYDGMIGRRAPMLGSLLP